MKPWLDPNLSESEYKFVLFNWWDNLPDWQRTKALIKEMVTAGVDAEGLLITNDTVSNC